MGQHVRLALCLLLSAAVTCSSARPWLGGSSSSSNKGSNLWPRPDHTEHAKMARWLVHSSDWGVLASTATDGTPVGGVASVSDGPADAPSGRLYFYLTPMDEVTQNLQADPRASFTLAEAALPGACGDTDPEDPTCSKVTLLGRLRPVPQGAAQLAAQAALFSRHPAMAGWPAGHQFKMYELHLQEAHLLDYYGGMAVITPEDYFAAALDPPTAAAAQQRQQQAAGQQQGQPASHSPQQRLQQWVSLVWKGWRHQVGALAVKRQVA